MIKLIETDKRQYRLIQVSDDGVETIVHDYNLIYSPGSNKYNVLFSYVENMCNTLGKECENWYINLIKEYSEKQDFEILVWNTCTCSTDTMVRIIFIVFSTRDVLYNIRYTKLVIFAAILCTFHTFLND